MKIVVYFESSASAVAVAQFSSDELYNACLPILEKEARDMDMIVTESCFEDDEIFDKLKSNYPECKMCGIENYVCLECEQFQREELCQK